MPSHASMTDRPAHVGQEKKAAAVAAGITIARLVAETEGAVFALRGESSCAIDHVPFKVGREGRLGRATLIQFLEQRLGRAPQLNDLYLLESPYAPYSQISREHFLIDREANGTFVLVDRKSHNGTLVNGERIGGRGEIGRTTIEDGDLITVGVGSSPFVFTFRIG